MKIKKIKYKYLNPILIILIIISVVIISAGFMYDKINLKEDKALREEVYQQILSDKALMNEFMDRMMNNQQSMYWMMENGPMMHRMFDSDNLQYIMHHNMDMSDHMYNHMMMAAENDSTIRMQWNNMMMNYHQGHMGGMGGMHK